MDCSLKVLLFQENAMGQITRKKYDEFSVFIFDNVHILANMFEERVMLLLHDPADNVTPNLLVAGRVLP